MAGFREPSLGNLEARAAKDKKCVIADLVPLLALRTAKFIAKRAYQGKECCLRFLLRFSWDHPPFSPETSRPNSPLVLDARKRQHSTQCDCVFMLTRS